MTDHAQVRLLLSAGRGPRECAWAVAELLHRLQAEAGAQGVTVRRVDAVPGERGLRRSRRRHRRLPHRRTGRPAPQQGQHCRTGPTGLVVVVDTERQFSANRRIALQRLRQRIEQAQVTTQQDATADRWATHDQLIRGNPTRTERPRHDPPPR